jgi:hypothetical protein
MLHPTHLISLKWYLQLNVVSREGALVSSIERRKLNWVGSISRKILPLKHFIEGNIEGAVKTMKKT